MSKIIHKNIYSIDKSYKCENNNYEYFRRKFVTLNDTDSTSVSVYEIPPRKSAYPYHYHLKNEETFYIISGEGVMKTPEGDVPVSAGDLFFFPAGDSGAHKLTNTSDTDNLVYIDFDSVRELNVAVYPDSDKIGIFGKEINKIFKLTENVNYYDGE